jgi:CheY-like chemotaxis protein/two-component sensor histidine kinase
VSHELSNVLGAILGWATLARRGEVAPGIDRALSLIEKSARSANATARHLLDTARGRTVVSNHTIDASGLVAEIAEVLSTKAEQKGVKLSVEIAESLELPGNRADLFTICWNLVQNAIEATPSGGEVQVHLDSERKGVRFEVQDQGDGIPEDIRHRVFEPYFTTKSDGTGLGLSLVRRAADALGGSVILDDSEKGAHFVCRFPKKRAKKRSSAPAGPRQSGVREKVSPRGKRILIVDDDEAMRDLLATTLGLAGAQVETAATGTEALDAQGFFDLVLIDLGLGDVRGDLVLAELRTRGQAGATALVSGATLPPNLSGVPDSWLRKPFEIDDLLSAVETLLGRSEAAREAKSG